MNDDKHIRLLELKDERDSWDKCVIPDHVMKRERRLDRLMRDFKGVSEEFCLGDEEYIDFVSKLSRQDIERMIYRLRCEIKRTDYTNRAYIRHLQWLTPQKIWSGR